MVSPEPPERTRILLADDEGLFLNTTADLLGQEGYRCDKATNGWDGFEALRRGDYDLLITDIHMPGNGDLGFVRRGKAFFPDLTVILVTGYPNLETAIEGIEVGVDHYLTKPVEIDTLLLKVREALASKDGSGPVSGNGMSETEAVTASRSLQGVVQSVGALAHDLKNMLSVADGCLSLSEEIVDPTHRVQEFLKESRLAVRRAARMTRELLDLSKPCRKEIAAPVDLETLFAELESMARVRARSGCEFVASISPDAPRALADREGLFDALFNLITNAVDSISDAGGIVHLRAESSREIGDEVGSSSPRGLTSSLAIRVIDNGPGIPRDLLGRIRNPYFTTKTPEEGCGLGLAIVQRFVEENGGRVEIESEPGVGTRATLHLPSALSFERNRDAD